MAAKARKPFISRKRRKEMDAARAKRETMVFTQEQERRSAEANERITSDEKRPIQLPPSATVGEFSKLLEIPFVKVISQFMKNGIMAAINDRVDYDTMAILADELGFLPEPESIRESAKPPVSEKETTPSAGREPRPPIVTIMGHVDHGKTSLLDKIRQTKVAADEAGGITQHIGAYQANIEYEGKSRLITFLDTPGHEAFTALRSHGAEVTDIVVLVVAGDDGIKPQTIEAIQLARTANVPIIVALTKIDLPTVNLERVKQQLTEHGLIPEEWGGTTIVIGVSSRTGEGIPELLEFIALTADLKNYRADPNGAVQGVIIESHLEIGLGPVATVLVQNGTLRVGDVLVVGQTFGKIRSMTNYLGEKISAATPSMPVKIAGIESIPNFGESFVRVKNEREARDLALASPQEQTGRGISDISQSIAEGRTNTLKIILKADAQGSLEALKSAIGKLQQTGVKPLIVNSSIGDITLSDLQLAMATTAVVFGFQVAIPAQIKKMAESSGITVATFKIIYELLEQVDLALQGRMRTEVIKVEKGRFKVKKIFRRAKDMQIVGGDITQGVAIDPASVTVMRNDELLGEGKILALQKGPEKVSELEAGQECGISVQLDPKLQAGDSVIFYQNETVPIQ